MASATRLESDAPYEDAAINQEQQLGPVALLANLVAVRLTLVFRFWVKRVNARYVIVR